MDIKQQAGKHATVTLGPSDVEKLILDQAVAKLGGHLYRSQFSWRHTGKGPSAVVEVFTLDKGPEAAPATSTAPKPPAS